MLGDGGGQGWVVDLLNIPDQVAMISHRLKGGFLDGRTLGRRLSVVDADGTSDGHGR
jgi:hypothetical protein